MHHKPQPGLVGQETRHKPNEEGAAITDAYHKPQRRLLGTKDTHNKPNHVRTDWGAYTKTPALYHKASVIAPQKYGMCATNHQKCTKKL